MALAFFRSEPMELCHLLLHIDGAFDYMMHLGHLGMVQFNNVYDEDRILNGLFTKQVQHCHELLRIVQYLMDQMAQVDIKEIFYPDVDVENIMRETDLQDYDRQLRELQTSAHQVMEHYHTLEKRKYYLIEWRFALTKADRFLAMDGTKGSQLLYSESTIGRLIKDQSDGEPGLTNLNYLVGSIHANRYEAFELLLFRIFGRNLILRHVELPEPVIEVHGNRIQLVRKYVLLMVTATMMWRPKLMRCCHAFHVTIFECPETPSARRLKLEEVQKDIDDINLVLDESNQLRVRVLNFAAADLYIWRINLQKAKKIYDLLNRMSPVGGIDHRKYLQAECFVPASHVNEVRQTLRNTAKDHDGLFFPPILLRSSRKMRHTPPTYFRLNKFTQGFQNLIDAYGMADYREINPAPYTIITFPFLFAIMFGDMGHGTLMVSFACILILREKSIETKRRTTTDENEILNLLYSGRYIVLLMGLFSVYIGLIYNDTMSKAINIFGSSWSCVYNETVIAHMTGELVFNPSSRRFYSGNPYPIGMDPIWKACGEDSITTFNSLKMKMAITLGIVQMMFGLTLSAINCVLLKRTADLLLIVIPQFIFMICLFCYLVFLVFYKWVTYGGLKKKPYHSACAPSVLITFIDMMLMKTTQLPDPKCPKGMFPNERLIEYILVFIAFATVPVLLAGKPIYLTIKQRSLEKKRKRERDLTELRQKGREAIKEMRTSMRYSIGYEENTPSRKQSQQKMKTAKEVEFDKSEIWIHSGIHTIESVLGSVSHTASYLRLWALSLAHDQLSDVLWHMILSKGLHSRMPHYIGIPVLIVAFLIWAVLTVAILVMMEGLSAFLHTLRLHWVEFQSKFFSGSGEKFAPFYFPRSTIRD
ncbi:V-type proton ATPase 116 kDa subunit a [Scaptodrosophila lebanonensis]|uniref:V-type proton ATPase subunit a n=1 Tax=Drosophila lebanonensis TaxID=7225 RepID=A0A6J2TKN9_DROLE|nr:V-type proton ATPase 116 kDa subunit a [Scaptodrosophila lebanonensis]